MPEPALIAYLAGARTVSANGHEAVGGRKRLHVNRSAATGYAAAVVVMVLLAGCGADEASSSRNQAPDGEARTDLDGRDPSVTVSGDDRIAKSLTWDAPDVALTPDVLAKARERAAMAVTQERLYENAESAIPLYLAILQLAPADAEAKAGLQQALQALIESGDQALGTADDEIDALRSAHRIAAVARSVQAEYEQAEHEQAGDEQAKDEQVQAYLTRVDIADRLWELNRQAERELGAGRHGENGGGALAKFREALRLRPQQPRAMQGLAAVESGLIRRAEQAAAQGDFDTAQRWLAHATQVRPDSATGTIAEARARIAGIRYARVVQLRDEGLVALQQADGIASARRILAEILRIAEPGNAAAAELRQRIDLATHYGLFRPGQGFTDALKRGGRGPEMVVVPHGGFRMGAADGEADAEDSERPVRYVRFDRGFAMSRNEVTVDDFRRFVRAGNYEPRASRRGYSLAYEERSGNFVRRSGVGWQSDHAGAPAADNAPVLHVSARDAQAYADWLGEQSGQRYRLPSEAEFEYALRAGGNGRFPWGDGAPPAGAGNLTGSRDHSPGGRRWRNAFAGYGDGYWGPAPVGRFSANAYGLHDLAGNLSEWVADCWHDSYRRAPDDGAAWINPGCRTRVIRGGAWASAPEDTRSAWRAAAGADTTNPRIGFRVVREL